MEYDILKSHNSRDLINQVEVAMSNGWFPAGGVALAQVPDRVIDSTMTANFYFMQAMVRH